MTYPSDNLKRGPATTTCGDCDSTSYRVGAQDNCDVYVCSRKHVMRIKVGSSKWYQMRTISNQKHDEK